MLKINIITLGKSKTEWVNEAIEHYKKLLKKFVHLSFICIPDIKKSHGLSEKEIKKQEAARLNKKFISEYRIALSDKGRQFASEQFAQYLSHLLKNSGGSVDFIIGGIYGLDDSIINDCRDVVSLSPLTMSHQLIRPVLLEQLFRGFSILSGGKYHR
jgi:23S rRNA (pseudouridine1915-N3)-methyltransferase